MSTIQTFRNPVLSLWQSAISKAGKNGVFLSANENRMNHFVQVAQACMQGKKVPSSDTKGDIIDECLKIIVGLAIAEIHRDVKRYTELMNEFQMSTCDPGWLETLKLYLEFKKQKGTIPYIRYRQLSDFIIPIPNTLKIACIADWGTGSQAAEWLLKEVVAHQPDLIIHLGDIYYSGTMDEVQDHFLSIIQKVAGNIPVYTLSGNHDMYSGGKGYYWLLRELNQPASYFCLRNDYWQFLAMDTGLHDSNPFTISNNVTYLDPSEEIWHLDKLSTAGKRKTILLSHHQLFSSLGVGKDELGQPIGFNPNLKSAFHQVLDQVSLWLWGHEHNLIVFNPYLNLKKGRCIGSGAIPMMLEQRPYKPTPNLNLQGLKQPPTMNLKKAKLSVNRDGFYFHAYAMLSLKGSEAIIRYYQVNSIQRGKSRFVFSESLGP
ncbi:metallophosphoesterase [Ammoniphilus sp. YIM 78166]|uniref:metallophosphoesterase family protein n=1 Tax=Ammoniphilus sp. YIM 78166 TaxID=1644106 RepID=UPI0014308672|nr:metallophosphoesterase [Ammoniphilus sp. YIM 78166]